MKILAGELGARHRDHQPAQAHLGPQAGPVRLRGRPRARRGAAGATDPLGHYAGEGGACSTSSSSPDDDGHRLAELEAIIGEEDGYTRREPTPATLLSGLGRPEADHAPADAGDPRRLRSCACSCWRQALFGKPQALLLDEPTNNLDLDSIRWLEGFSCHGTRASLIVISHDRHFLNAICTHIADIDYQTDHHLHRRLRRHGDGQERRSARGSSRRTPRSRRRSPSSRTSWPASRPARAPARCRAARSRSRSCSSPTSSESNIERPFIKFESRSGPAASRR